MTTHRETRVVEDTGLLIASQEGDGADCRHTNEPFDVSFRSINSRTDLSSDAKLVHARLVSMHRLGRSWTQAEIGCDLGLSRHQVWRALEQLKAADLVQVIRIGLGQPNAYVLLGIPDEDLSGRASRRRPAGQGMPASRASSRAGTYVPKKKTGKMDLSTPTTKDYLETRYGRLVRPPCERCGVPEGWPHGTACHF